MAGDNYCSKFPKDCSIGKITKESGNFVEVEVGYNPGGALAMLEKTGNTYVLIQIYQEPPQCKLMQKFEVPKEFYGSCYDDDGNSVQ